MNRTVYTLGYASLSIERFRSLLVRHGVTALCDVRSNPNSRANPDFGRQTLSGALQASDIEYVFLGKELGARSPDPKVYRDGRVQYELLAATPAFQRGLDRIETGSAKYTIALMCAERDPLTCHRSILVARHLIERGFEVEHILDTGALESHSAAMRRLVRMFGFEQKIKGNEQLIERHIYELQGQKIAFHDPDFRPDRADHAALPGVL